jgi:hypothetical protein
MAYWKKENKEMYDLLYGLCAVILITGIVGYLVTVKLIGRP